MPETRQTNSSEAELDRLEYRIGELISVCERLQEENRSLRQQQQQLITERANLIERNEQVRVRVEAMINRLRQMERT